MKWWRIVFRVVRKGDVVWARTKPFYKTEIQALMSAQVVANATGFPADVEPAGRPLIGATLTDVKIQDFVP